MVQLRRAMKIGISPDAIRPAAGLVDLARRVEAAGFDSIWVPDHLAFFGSPVVVYFSMKSDTDVVYEILDKNLNLKKAITVQDFAEDWKNWSR